MLDTEEMIKKNNVLVLGFFMVLLFISFTSAVSYQLQYDDSNVDYAVITKAYKIILNNPSQFDLSVDYSDTLSLQSRTFGVDIYDWTLNAEAGIRTFTLDNETFEVNSISEIEELFNHVDSFSININQDSSIAEINNLDVTGATNEYYDFSFDEFSGSFSLQNILNGITLDFTFEQSADYPTYNSLDLTGRAYTILDDIIIFNQDSLSYETVENVLSNYSLLNELIDIYGVSGNYEDTLRVIKTGNNYYFNISHGYGNFNSTTMDRIRNAISDGLNLVSPSEIISYLSPYYDLSEYLDEITWETSIDASSLELTDGTYSIPILLTDSHGNTYTETITVILDINTNEEQVIVGDTYIPVNEEVIEIIQEIVGLPTGSTVSVAVHGAILPPAFVATSAPVEVEDSINYIEINLSTGSVGDYRINFTVADSFDANRVQAYVYESGSWVGLPTTFIKTESGKHYFYFTVTHFSQFLIAETIVPVITSGNNNNGNCNTHWQCTAWSNCINEVQIRECSKIRSYCDVSEIKPEESRTCSLDAGVVNNISEPINVGGNPSENEESSGLFNRLTGAVVGTLGPAGSMVAIVLFILILILIFATVRIKKLKRKQAERLRKAEDNLKATREKKQRDEERLKEEAAKAKKVKADTLKGTRKTPAKKVDKRKKAKVKSKTKPKKKVTKKSPNTLKGTRKKAVKKNVDSNEKIVSEEEN